MHCGIHLSYLLNIILNREVLSAMPYMPFVAMRTFISLHDTRILRVETHILFSRKCSVFEGVVWFLCFKQFCLLGRIVDHFPVSAVKAFFKFEISKWSVVKTEWYGASDRLTEAIGVSVFFSGNFKDSLGCPFFYKSSYESSYVRFVVLRICKSDVFPIRRIFSFFKRFERGR